MLNDEIKNLILQEIRLLAKNNYGPWKNGTEAMERIYNAIYKVFEDLKEEIDVRDIQVIKEE